MCKIQVPQKGARGEVWEMATNQASWQRGTAEQCATEGLLPGNGLGIQSCVRRTCVSQFGCSHSTLWTQVCYKDGVITTLPRE